MNRALLNPFEASDLPKTISEYLEQDKATCVRFNRHGNLLAAGTTTGRVVVWDFETRTVACYLGDPVRDCTYKVTSVSFPAPRNGSSILVSYDPGMIRLFDTISTAILTEVRFDVPIVQTEAHPKNLSIAVIVPKDSHPLVLHLRRGVYQTSSVAFAKVINPDKHIPIPLDRSSLEDRSEKMKQYLANCSDPQKSARMPQIPSSADFLSASVLCTSSEFQNGVSIETTDSRRKSPFCVTITSDGKHILRGGPCGIVRSFSLQQQQSDTNVPVAVCDSVVTMQGRAAIRSITLSRKNEKVLVNSQDRSMRLFLMEQILAQRRVQDGNENYPVLEPVTTFTEIVNKTQCHCACFSKDGDFVLGGMEGAEHRIHVWRVADGHLEVTLDGAKEGIEDILWHPLRPVIASLGSSFGGVYVWEKNFTENWSAFAPDFSELEANEEYIEAEDEFDLRDPEDEEKRLEAREKEEAGLVDIETCDGGWFSSDSEGPDTFFFIPAKPRAESPRKMQSLADDLLRAKLPEAAAAGGNEMSSDGVCEEGSVAGKKRSRSADGKVSVKSKKAKTNQGRKSSEPQQGEEEKNRAVEGVNAQGSQAVAEIPSFKALRCTTQKGASVEDNGETRDTS